MKKKTLKRTWVIISLLAAMGLSLGAWIRPGRAAARGV